MVSLAFFSLYWAITLLNCLQGEKEDEGEEESSQKDKFEENYKELTKWVDVKSSKFGTLTVLREKRLSRLGTALKVNTLIYPVYVPRNYK